MEGYYYEGHRFSSKEELYFWIVVDTTLEQLGVDDAAAVVAILSGQPILNTRTKFEGATQGTSLASKYASKLLPYQSPIRLPTLTGRNILTLKLTFTNKLGRFVGRAIPVVGWVILASDITQIIWQAQLRYNQVVNHVKK